MHLQPQLLLCEYYQDKQLLALIGLSGDIKSLQKKKAPPDDIIKGVPDKSGIFTGSSFSKDFEK